MPPTKRKHSPPTGPDKRLRLESGEALPINTRSAETSNGKQGMTEPNLTVQPPRKQKVVKLAPPRPFPTVATSVNATGPPSSHKEGKNLLCVTRKTPLGAYLRRCKELVMNDGYKTIYLSALGAAIPHLLLLSTSIPRILPLSHSEIKTEVKTATVEVTDELVPEDEEEEGGLRVRGKGAVHIVITIGDGLKEVAIEPGRKGKGIPRGKRQRGAIVKVKPT